MKNKKKQKVSLTETQRGFVEKLIIENKIGIHYTIRSVLGEVYGYLTEDCISELYLLMCTKISVLEHHPSPKAWLLVAAKMTAFSIIKSNKKDTENVPIEYADIPVGDTTHEEALYSIWLENDVGKKLIDKLTKREREIYHKLYIEKKDIEITACELNLSASTVRSFKKLIKDKIEDLVRKNI